MSNAMEQKSVTTQKAVKKWKNSQGLRLSKEITNLMHLTRREQEIPHLYRWWDELR